MHITCLQEFFTTGMVNASSRGSELGTWKMATVVPMAEDEALDFYLTNGQLVRGGHKAVGNVRQLGCSTSHFMHARHPFHVHVVGCLGAEGDVAPGPCEHNE